MTTALAPATPAIEAQRLLDPDSLDAAPSRRPTLEQPVLDAWHELRLRGATACLVCGDATDEAGTCASCGSQLS